MVQLLFLVETAPVGVAQARRRDPGPLNHILMRRPSWLASRGLPLPDLLRVRISSMRVAPPLGRRSRRPRPHDHPTTEGAEVDADVHAG